MDFSGFFSQRINNDFPRTRIDQYLGGLSGFVSRNFWHSALNGNFIRVNGKNVRKSFVLRAGDLVEFDYYAIYEKLKNESLKIKIPYTLLFECDDYVVVDKPQGYLTHRIGFIDHSVMSQVGEDLNSPMYTVHRLDKYTSGTCLFARNSTAADKLQSLLRGGQIFKYYMVATKEKLSRFSGLMCEPIGKDDPRIHKKKQKVDFINGQEARTRYRFLHSKNEFQYYLVRIFTGRQHQIRVHFQHAGAPVAFDELYSYDDYSHLPPMYSYSETNLGLHAVALKFVCPFMNKAVKFTSLPGRFPF